MSAKVIPLTPRPSAPAPSDEVLVSACAAGDREALGLLYDRHQKVVWRFLGRLLGPQAPEIDDLVQGSFLELWRSAGRFGGRSTVQTWLLGIAHNLARKSMRDRGRRRDAHARLAQISEPSFAPEGRWQDRILIERMQVAVQTLSEPLRSAFVLCDVEGLKGVEAAQVLGIRPGTLWRRLHDARRRLRAAMEGEAR